MHCSRALTLTNEWSLQSCAKAAGFTSHDARHDVKRNVSSLGKKKKKQTESQLFEITHTAVQRVPVQLSCHAATTQPVSVASSCSPSCTADAPGVFPSGYPLFSVHSCEDSSLVHLLGFHTAILYCPNSNPPAFPPAISFSYFFSAELQ